MIIILSGKNGYRRQLGFASERAKGRGAVWAKSGHVAQYCCDMLLARSGHGRRRKGIHQCWKQSLDKAAGTIIY